MKFKIKNSHIIYISLVTELDAILSMKRQKSYYNTRQRV